MEKGMACWGPREQVTKACRLHIGCSDCFTHTFSDAQKHGNQFLVHPQEASLKTTGPGLDPRNHPKVLSTWYLSGHLHGRNRPSQTRQHVSILPPKLGLAEALRSWILPNAKELEQGKAAHQVQATDNNQHERSSGHAAERR